MITTFCRSYTGTSYDTFRSSFGRTVKSRVWPIRYLGEEANSNPWYYYIPPGMYYRVYCFSILPVCTTIARKWSKEAIPPAIKAKREYVQAKHARGRCLHEPKSASMFTITR